jgi:signal transduction histidine kinase
VKGLPARVATLPPRLQDAIVGVALTLVNVGTLLPYRSQLHPQAAGYILVILESLPLIWRRSRPVTVFLIIGFAREAYDQVPLSYAPLPLGPAIAYFTVMDRCSTRVRCAVSALLLAGIITSQLPPGHSEPYDFFVAVLVFAAAGMAGILSRTRRAYLAEVESRAARAESERDREVSLAAARERTRIARELHDIVAHHVSLIAVQAEAANSLLPGHPAGAGRSVEIIGQTARLALTELRRLLGVLRGPAERPETTPSASLAELDMVLDQVRSAGRARPGSRPDSLPDRAGSPDQHHPPFPAGAGIGDPVLRAGVHHCVRGGLWSAGRSGGNRGNRARRDGAPLAGLGGRGSGAQPGGRCRDRRRAGHHDSRGRRNGRCGGSPAGAPGHHAGTSRIRPGRDRRARRLMWRHPDRGPD